MLKKELCSICKIYAVHRYMLAAALQHLPLTCRYKGNDIQTGPTSRHPALKGLSGRILEILLIKIKTNSLLI
jgi:hypothetical protein